ncbi:MAG: DMT family transporter [Rhizobiaceae bacterium]
MLPPAILRRLQALPDNAKGSLVLLCAAFFFTLMATSVKLLGSHLHVTQILLVRQIVMSAIVAPMILRGFPGVLATRRPGLQLVRIGFALAAMLLGFTAVIHLPLADATAIGFAKSFFVTILAVVLLSEPVGPRRWAAVAAGFAGVIIMVKPGTDGFSIYGLMAIVGAASAGTVMVIIRILSRTESNTTILTWQALGVGLMMLVPAVWFWKWPEPWEWLMLLGMGFVSYVGQMLNIMAYRLGEASVMASLDYVRLIYATIIGFLVFSTLPGVNTWVGAGLIVAASIYTIRREARRKQVIAATPDGRGLS